MNIKIEKLEQNQLHDKGVFGWDIWTKEKSKFDWFYDVSEQCYFLDGRVKVSSEYENVEFGKGDFVTFPKGLACTWEIIEPVRKHYYFE